MQLLPRDKYLELIKMPDTVEADSNAFIYSDFLKKTDSIYESLNDPYKAYDEIRDSILVHLCPPIKLCGEGSSRAAYALAGGKCLKLAMCEAGVEQNRQELKICNENRKKYCCFPNFYDYDRKHFMSILTDCCMQAKEEDFMKIYNVDYDDIFDVLELFFASKKPPSEAYKTIILRYYDTGKGRHYEDTMQDICRGIASGEELKYKVFHDLLQYYYDNNSDDSELMLDDLLAIENYGIHAVDGQQIPILIDVGLSEDIYNVFYK